LFPYIDRLFELIKDQEGEKLDTRQ